VAATTPGQSTLFMFGVADESDRPREVVWLGYPRGGCPGAKLCVDAQEGENRLDGVEIESFTILATQRVRDISFSTDFFGPEGFALAKAYLLDANLSSRALLLVTPGLPVEDPRVRLDGREVAALRSPYAALVAPLAPGPGNHTWTVSFTWGGSRYELALRDPIPGPDGIVPEIAPAPSAGYRIPMAPAAVVAALLGSVFLRASKRKR
jgi:hypothetical protein